VLSLQRIIHVLARSYLLLVLMTALTTLVNMSVPLRQHVRIDEFHAAFVPLAHFLAFGVEFSPASSRIEIF